MKKNYWKKNYTKKDAINHVEQFLETYENSIRDTLTSENWRAYCEFKSRFHKYSDANTQLIMAQFPTATYVASYTNWKKLNRYVMKDTHGIKIFAPNIKVIDKVAEVKSHQDKVEKITVINGFRIVTVFDISQTGGEEIPNICKPVVGENENAKVLIDCLHEIIDIPIVNKADIQIEGYFSYIGNTPIEIAYNSELEPNNVVATLIHEGSHYRVFKDVISGKIDLNYFLKESEKGTGLYGIEEIIVESVSCITCAYFGIDTKQYSFEYVASWSRGDLDKIKKVRSLIHTLSCELIDSLTDAFSKRVGIDGIMDLGYEDSTISLENNISENNISEDIA
jgi:antirestriction protein ArdC